MQLVARIAAHATSSHNASVLILTKNKNGQHNLNLLCILYKRNLKASNPCVENVNYVRFFDMFCLSTNFTLWAAFPYPAI